MSSKKFLKIVFGMQVGIFVVIMVGLFAPLSDILGRKLFPLMAVFSFLFFFLGIILIKATRKQKIKGKLGRYLTLTGISSSGFLTGAILHNFFYALSVVTQNITVLHYLIEAFHVIFFLISTIACPVGFLIGVVGSIVLFAKERKNK